ncbi:MAG: type IV secretory system conjugative DNA transfer family protein [Firmicutes bacterium]|nr:type IV secretory system conjugative DNA transfer family protein [Bacillota bacterium]
MDKNKKKIMVIVLLAIGAVALLFFSAFIVSLIFRSSFSLANPYVYALWGALIGIALIALLLNHKTRMGKRVLKVNKDLEDSRWLTWGEIKKNKGLTVTKLSRLSTVKDGVPIYAEKKGEDIQIVLAKTIHTLVVGTTGSGKTTTFVDPAVQILSRCQTKPCMVITDPKGEIYKHHAENLKEQGYTVSLIDLADIYHSTHWNPFNDVWKMTDRIQSAIDSKSLCWNRGRYEFDGRKYDTFSEAEREFGVFVQELTDEIYLGIQDLIYAACPIENKHDSTWQKGARDLIFGLALAMWEDVRDGYMTRKQFNLFNLSENIAKYCTGDFDQIKEYFNNRDSFSKAKNAANTVLVSQDRTLTSYLGDVNAYFNWMADKGIVALTSSNEIEFDEFDERPNALFLKIPDEKDNRHKLIALFITQMYKALVAKAALNNRRGLTKEAELFRNVYFIMDEFGNMPKFHHIDKIITVGRSRKIFMLPVIQDFKQLENRYDKEIAAIIKSNCPIKIFIQAGDKETTEEFSALCGKHKVKKVSYSEQKELSISTSAEEKPLIFPSELANLNDAAAGRMGNAVVLAAGKNPLRSRFTPWFKAQELYSIGDAAEDKKQAEVFDEADYYYDITKRSAFVAELAALEEEADGFADELLEQLNLEEENGGNADGQVTAIAKRIYINLDKLIVAKLKDKLSIGDFARLVKMDISAKMAFLEQLVKSAVEKKNNFLLFDLAYIKNHIRTMCFPESQDNTSGA